ncbi:MAG: hypothetical protein NWE93_11280 [Candidatus Bathyarchaeota archaeon]|nr:hypothetical protein [Candidatus Bathyarchaeota archaeon]
MPLFNNEIFYCPNTECPNDKKLKQEEKCPECGSNAQGFGWREATNIITAKKEKQQAEKQREKEAKQTEKITEKIEAGTIDLLVTEKMTDEEIQKKNYLDMVNLIKHEAGTGWMRAGTIMSGNTTDMILGAGLKAIIDQNKILIRQNELILRALNKETGIH